MTFLFQNDPIWPWPILTRYGFSMKLFCKLLLMFNVLIISMLVFECVRKNSLFEFLKNSIKCFSLPLLLFLVNWFSCKIRQYNSNKPPFRSPPTCLLPLSFCPSTGVKSAIEATFCALRVQFLLIIRQKHIFLSCRLLLR